MKNTKREINLYPFYDVTGMKNHFEKMAEKGWFLEKIGNFFWIYRRGEPKKLNYAVSYYAKASVFDTFHSEAQETFIDFCNYSGWQLVAESAKLQIFCNERENPVPIYTEPLSEIEAIEKSSKIFMANYIIIIIIIGLLNIGMNIWSFKRDPVTLLANGTILSVVMALSLMEIYFIADIIHYCLWKKKAKHMAEQGVFTPTDSNLHKVQGVLLTLAVGITILGVALSGSSSVKYVVAAQLGLYAAMMAVILFIKKKLKEKRFSKEKNMVIVISAIIVLSAVVTAVMSFGIFSSVSRNAKAEAFNKLPITAESLGKTDKVAESRRFNRDSSFLLEKTDAYEVLKGETIMDVNILSYDIVTVKFKPLFNLCFDWYLNQYKSFGSYNDDYDENNPFYKYIKCSDSFGADEAYQLYKYGEADSTYLLKYGNKILKIETDWDLTYENLISLKDKI